MKKLEIIIAVLLLFGTGLYLVLTNSGKSELPVLNRADQVAEQEISGKAHPTPLVDPSEIIGGGPPQDGIPSIDAPLFDAASEVDYLDETEPGIALSIGGTHRFYPYQILVWHEIVNDTMDGSRVLITYCPLCFSGIVFDPIVKGEEVEFGTSGKLWQSNLVMYDRKTRSYWSQILGQAIMGEVAGQSLNIIPSDIMTFGEWSELYPNGQVLSRDTGFVRFYGADPYGDYYTTPGTIFDVRASDDRLHEKEVVLGVVVDGSAHAWKTSTIEEMGTIEAVVGEKQLIATYNEEKKTIRITDAQSGDIVGASPTFWFAWVAAYPETGLSQ
ncbi:MAG: DUF3179 domain-containing protein [Candidatus Magasanikbacteria bacterium]|jgi:hypothetical protein|nr:DUF3179 domain-containing protein [Candidatus Magasanikbacteria bacterium]